MIYLFEITNKKQFSETVLLYPCDTLIFDVIVIENMIFVMILKYL